MQVNLPSKILVEKSVKGAVKDFLDSLNLGRKYAILTTEGIRKIASGISYELEGKFIETNGYSKVYCGRLAENLKDYDFALAIGGGRVIDIAKYSSFLASKPYVVFPTILSHDGVVSSRASLEDNGMKTSVKANGPAGIIVDLDIIKKSPYRQLAAGAGDLLAKISAVQDWKLAAKRKKEIYHAVMGELSLLSAKAVIENSEDIQKKSYHGLEVLFWALVSSGIAMNIYGSSRPGSGSEHNFSHALEKLGSKALHGQQTAMGSIISLYLQGGDWRQQKRVMKELRLPTTYNEMGLEKDTLIKALVMARDIRHDERRYTILNEVNLDEKKAKHVLERVGII